METWATAHGHQLHMLAPELDAKGSDADRPIFREAVEGVKGGRFEGILVAYLSRAGRDLRLMLDLWDEIEAAGGTVYSARENIDGSTAAGRLHRNLLASIDQHALEERREGFDRARSAAVERGIWQRRQTPTGYRRDTETRRLVTDDRADDVRGAARDLLAGAPFVEIARRMGMTTSGLRYLLRNRVYLGELKVGVHVNTDAHEAILDAETFAAVTARLTGPKRTRSGKPVALLAGLVRCAACGHIMTRASSDDYLCTKNHSGGRCPKPSGISCTKLDTYVESITDVELDRIRIDRAAGSRLGDLRRITLAARAELNAYLQAVDAAGLGPEAADGMRQRREVVDSAERGEQAEMSRSPVLPESRSGSAEYRKLDVAGRNHVLRSLLSAVMVRRAGWGNPLVIERVRVLKFGADIPRDRGAPELGMGIQPFWPDLGSNDVLGFSGGD